MADAKTNSKHAELKAAHLVLSPIISKKDNAVSKMVEAMAIAGINQGDKNELTSAV